jgi:hypothetical protein
MLPFKLENQAETPLPKKALEHIESVVSSLPREHLRGIEKLRIVDAITDPRLKALGSNATNLPGLYHPKQGIQQAFIEIALIPLLKPNESFFKRITPRMTFKSNAAYLIVSLIGQHYYITFRHSVKKGQIESGVKQYTEKYLKAWSEKNQSWRTKLFKPFQPTLERWAKSLQKKAGEQQKKAIK